MNTNKIRIGQIGAKHAHASGKFGTIRKLTDLYDVVGIVEPDEDHRNRVANQPAYQGTTWITEEQLFNTPGLQAVAVETEVADLVPTALRCIRAGCHIHLDKPAGPSLSACRDLHAAADKAGLTIQMGYMFRYNPGFEFLFRAVDSSWLGPITELNAIIGKYATEDLRRDNGKFSGGCMFELGCHIIDQMITVLGAPADVEPFTYRSRPDGLADNQLAVFRYPTAAATIRCNYLDPHDRRKFEVIGETGAVIIDPLEPPRAQISLVKPAGGYQKGYQTVELPKTGGRYDGEFIDLARVIRGEKPFRWNSAHDLIAHEAILRASGMPVD